MGQECKALLLLLCITSQYPCECENVFQRIGNFFRGNDGAPAPAPALPPSGLAPRPAEGPAAYQQLILSDPDTLGELKSLYLGSTFATGIGMASTADQSRIAVSEIPTQLRLLL
jgi:hypothetical protein